MASVRTQAHLTRDEAMRILHAHAEEIRAQGIVRLALFGSTARGDARPGSDVDLLVDYDESRNLSLLDIAGISARIEDLLGRAVEFADRKRLKPFLKDNILAEAIEIFPQPGHRQPRPEGSPMPPRSPRQRLQDILDAILFVERYIAGRTLDDYRRDDMLRAAVERKIEVISEATRRLPDDLTAAHANIPWGKIRGVGNILRHDYDEVYDEVVWNIAAQHLAPLKRPIRAMIIVVDRRDGR